MESPSKKKLTQEITQFLQEQIDADSDANPEVQKVFGDRQWTSAEFFQQPNSLRLRLAGHQLLKLYFDHEEFLLDRELKASELLILSNNMNAPFFITKRKIVLYSNEHIVMLKLAGDVTSWLKLFR